MSRLELFHGTVADLKVGDVVRPPGRGSKSSVHGSLGYRHGQRADEHAFATESEHEAWDFAGMSRGKDNGPWRGRGAVYKVEPVDPGDVRVGAYHPDHRLRARGRGPNTVYREHVSRTGFRVTDRIDAQPDHQSALPGIDWNQHHSYGTSSPWDANHMQLGSDAHIVEQAGGHAALIASRQYNPAHAKRAAEMSHPEGHPELPLGIPHLQRSQFG